MNALEVALRGIVADLSAARQEFALIGGLAVSIRTEPRFTQDADLVVSVSSDQESERLIAGLRQSGYEITALIEQVATDRLATVRLRPDGSSMIVDLLFASTGIEAEIVAGADKVEVLPGLSIPVASVGHLIAMKLLSTSERRIRDRGDLEALSDVATGSDWAVAHHAVSLIGQRGFGRNRDLIAALHALRSFVEAGPSSDTT